MSAISVVITGTGCGDDTGCSRDAGRYHDTMLKHTMSVEFSCNTNQSILQYVQPRLMVLPGSSAHISTLPFVI